MTVQSKSSIISMLHVVLCVQGFVSLHNTRNNVIPSLQQQQQHRISTLDYSNQVETQFTDTSNIPASRRSSIRLRKAARTSVSYKDNRRSPSIIEPMMNHSLLTKEEEYVLCNKISRMTNIRNKISDIVRGEPERAGKGSNRNSDILVEECSRLYGIEGEIQLAMITDEDISNGLGLKGGRQELESILEEGSVARQRLIECNMKLVSSIAKRWLRNSSRGNGAKLFSSDQPETLTLDDLVQEGVLGLSRAIDKFDTVRGLRFATYATHWITSHIRTTVKNAKYGCLRIPSGLQAIRTSYIGIVKPYSDAGQLPPSTDDIALELGISESRLQTALSVTQPLLSIDAPLASKLNNRVDGSGLTLMDTLICPESIKNEQRVELSFLRQYLENAMSAELSPHERDVIRLRLGLDDGITKTVKEVVEVCGGAVSTYDIRSVEKRAFQKLRSPNSLFTPHLLAFLDDEILSTNGCDSSSSTVAAV